MSTAQLFTPMRVGGLELANRIIIAPMCQYSGHDGSMTDWHLIHLGQLALSGAALLTIEATAVLPEGRITYADVGLYSDETETAVAHILDGVRRWSNMPIGIQLAHAGRKASTEKPWLGGAQIPAGQPNGWLETVSAFTCEGRVLHSETKFTKKRFVDDDARARTSPALCQGPSGEWHPL